MPTRVAQTAPDASSASTDTSQPLDTRAQNAALAAYNEAAKAYDDAFQKYSAMPLRPADDNLGHDTGGKGWDKDRQEAAAALESAKSQAAAASRQYATILDTQAKQAAADTSPAGLAKAAQAQAQAEYVHAKADGYAATTAAAQQAASTRAQAALTRANAATTTSQASATRAAAATTKADTLQTANGIYSKDDTNNPGPDGSPGWRLATDANGNPLPGTRDPSQTALTDAQAKETAARAGLTAQQAADLANKTPVELANLVRTGQYTQAQIDAIQQKLPGELSQQGATLAQTQAVTDEARQKIAQGNAPTSATPTAADQFITQRDPNTGALSSVPNPNAPVVDVGAKVQQLQQQAQTQRDNLQKQVQDGTLTQADALKQFNDFWNTQVEPQRQALATAQRTQQQQDFTNQVAARSSQNQSDQNTTTTANDLATHQQNAATMGSGLLQKRAELAQTAAQNVLGIGTGSKNFGIGGGAVPDVSNLFNAATQQAGQMLGGQSTMDAAQRMVQSIDPTNKSGFAQHAYAALSQVLDRAQGQQPLQPPPQADTSSLLDKSQYTGAFNPGAGPSVPSSAPASPTTTIAPDGTVTIQHASASVPDYAMGSINDPSRATPAIPVAQPLGV